MKWFALAVALAGCDYITSSHKTNPFSGDEFPIIVERDSGAIVIGLGVEGDTGTRNAVLDVMSPITLIDRGPGMPVSIGEADLTVLGARGAGGMLDLPRAVFTDRQLVTLHPCNEAVCSVGAAATPRGFDALVGMDVFVGDALRLHLATDEIFILPDIAGPEIHRSRSCDGVLPSPFRGGGTMILGGTELGFSNWRIALDACLAPNPDRAVLQSKRGVDALLVLSTAIGISIINASTYERIREIDTTAPELASLPEHTVSLPSGPITGFLAAIPGIALVGNSASNPRAPCRQVWSHHLLEARNCAPPETGAGCLDDVDNNANGYVNDGCPALVAPETGADCLNATDDDGDGFANDGCPSDDCPCPNDGFCPVPAIVEYKPVPPQSIAVLIVADSDPTLLALRTELRPDRPEVDGILGADALEALELDIDYSHDRLLARCVDRAICGTRPNLTEPSDRSFVNGCLGSQPGPYSAIP